MFFSPFRVTAAFTTQKTAEAFKSVYLQLTQERGHCEECTPTPLHVFTLTSYASNYLFIIKTGRQFDHSTVCSVTTLNAAELLKVEEGKRNVHEVSSRWQH